MSVTTEGKRWSNEKADHRDVKLISISTSSSDKPSGRRRLADIVRLSRLHRTPSAECKSVCSFQPMMASSSWMHQMMMMNQEAWNESTFSQLLLSSHEHNSPLLPPLICQSSTYHADMMLGVCSTCSMRRRHRQNLMLMVGLRLSVFFAGTITFLRES